MSLAYVLEAVGARVAAAAVRLLGSADDAEREFPFLADFAGVDPALPAWPPLDRLREAAGLDPSATTVLLALALVEEDARFGVLYEALQASPGQPRPTLGLVQRLWPGSRPAVRQLLDAALARVTNPDAPRADQALEVPAALWEALADGRGPAWAHHRTEASALPLAALVLDADTARRAAAVPKGDVTVVVRGARHNGRGTLLAGLARAAGRGTLEVQLPLDEARLALVGPLATTLDAMPVFRVDPAPGERVVLPWPAGFRGAVGVVMPRHGGLDGAIARRTVALRRDLPDVDDRARLWARHGEPAAARDLAARLRLPSGAIDRAARVAGRLELDAIREATRSLHREALDQLATPLAPVTDPEDLVLAGDAERELRDLVRRCRHRERLPHAVGPALRALTPGVRALLAGPSGTGKTLAARVLAGQLGLDLYRLDLSAVVNKYIGETEKNLERVFAHAEELDVMLLLDEGDALLSRRTAVSSATDRYANLETNFLLQRLESFLGVVVVTTNAPESIDPAFTRRMDVVIELPPPEPAERARIWARHLPAHDVPAAVIEDLAEVCRLTGGQIRNAAVYACLLALDEGRRPLESDLRRAVLREYRKMGAPAPWGG